MEADSLIVIYALIMRGEQDGLEDKRLEVYTHKMRNLSQDL